MYFYIKYAYFRNIFLQTFYKKIILIEKNNNIIENTHIYILPICSCFNKYYKYNIVYKIDNLYFYEEYNKTNNNKTIKFYPVILNAYIDNIEFNINKYSFNMPFKFIVKIDNLNVNSILKIYILKNTILINKEYKIHDILLYKLEELL
jgi:hypothetical protein